ncbi:HigA family addiction module antitoxin [Rickettsia australis]|uniref:Plasmid maintenance system antidote protein n=1 Tax=Rickettsia australis (strain Cutlack) TaxID=1105110 RepID=H8K7Z8_RICAC|nr:HigA family addiction module antitoxin [Rickettsia australis]AFC71391.1 plasmid maintenance system antidote protein [Rickettsia australis str. Cutlack]
MQQNQEFMTNKLPPISPGQILLEEFMEPMGISHSNLACDIGVPVTRINNIIKHHRSIIADTALRLGKYFSVNPRWWMNIQNQYDLELAEDEGWEIKEGRIRTFALAS